MPTKRLIAIVAAAGLTACASRQKFDAPKAETPREARIKDEAPAISALQEGRFADAEKAAIDVIAGHPNYAEAHAVRAVTKYKTVMHQLFLDARTVVIGAIAAGAINHKYLHTTFETAEAGLADVDADLALAAKSDDFALELCLACWEIDWNGNGRVDDGDRKLMEIEIDADDKPIPEGDPRRRPTFRFDYGDLHWGRAILSFQRAILDFILGRDFSEVDAAIARRNLASPPERVIIRVADAARVKATVEMVKAGLISSAIARQAFLDETDDDREWVPNPKQKSHPLPLPVDEALYTQWGALLGDVGRLFTSEEGLDLNETGVLIAAKRAEGVHGFLDIGKLVADPKDITIELGAAEGESPDAVLHGLFGDAVVPEMKRSPLTARLSHMRADMDGGKETLARKIKYLLWLN